MQQSVMIVTVTVGIQLVYKKCIIDKSPDLSILLMTINVHALVNMSCIMFRQNVESNW